MTQPKLLNKFISSLFAASLLLTGCGAIQAGAVAPSDVAGGAVVEVYSGDELQSSKTFDTPAQAWSNAVSSANDAAQTVVTLGDNWSGDDELTVRAGQHITLDLNGHYIKRNRNHQMKSGGGVFRVQENAVFTLRDSNPDTKGYDGVRGGVITGGASSNSAGGVHIEQEGEFRMEGGTIYDCITDADGGAVNVSGNSENTKFTMTGGRIYACKTMESTDECYGGAIYLQKGVVALSDATIDDCYSEDDGGAIYSERGTVMLNNVVFSGNKCQEQGGAIAVALDTNNLMGTLLSAYDCTFAGNRAEEDGGAVIISDNPSDNGAVLFHNCKFRNNSAGEDGGAFYVNDDNVALSSCEITYNRAKGYGGGVFVDGRYNVTLMGLTVIKDNSSDKGQGVSNLVLENGTTGTARVIDGGLYKNSLIHIGTTSNKSVMLSEWMSQYQMQYFVADEGTLGHEGERFVNASMVTTASIFSDGIYAIVIIGSAGLIATVILMIRKKIKDKKEGEDNVA